MRGGRLCGHGCTLFDAGRTGHRVCARQRGSGPPERSHLAQAAATIYMYPCVARCPSLVTGHVNM